MERAVLAMSIGIQWWYSRGTTCARTGTPTWGGGEARSRAQAEAQG